jgi:dihydroorotase
VLNDTHLSEFQSAYKVNPPLRDQVAVQAIKMAVLNDTISILCSWHQPQDYDHKNVEFSYANYGMINLETCFAIITTAFGDAISIQQLVEKLAINPRLLLGIDIPKIEKNQQAFNHVHKTHLSLIIPFKEL